MKRKQLTLDEHRWLGGKLYMIHEQACNARFLNQFKKNSQTARRILRVDKDIARLRSALDNILFSQHPSEADTSYYYGQRERTEELSMDVLFYALRYDVGDVINGKVLAPTIDLYLRCDRSLFKLRFAITEYPEDCKG
jgi:hypothetical protein